jgi:hypothetical protein
MKEYNCCSKCKWQHSGAEDLPCVICRGDFYEPAVKELVHHPSHYCYSEYEPKDVIRAWGLNFNLGSAVKYIARAGRKDDILQELNKARQFIEFEIEAIEKERGLSE